MIRLVKDLIIRSSSAKFLVFERQTYEGNMEIAWKVLYYNLDVVIEKNI